MKHLWKLLVVALVCLAPNASALEENEIGPVMQEKVDQILSILNDGNLTKSQRRDRIDVLMTPYFDFSLMAKLSLGKAGWTRATPQEREEYIRLFEDRIKNSYLSQADLYKEEKVVLEPPVKAKQRIHLNSYIIQKGEKKEVLYKFYRSKSRGWLIYDVDVLGVSIIQTYRSQFSNELQKGSMEELLAKLREPQT